MSEELTKEDLIEADEIYRALLNLGAGHHVGPLLWAVIHYVVAVLHYVVKSSPDDLKNFTDELLRLYGSPPSNPFDTKEKEAE